jgi:hypothetical protein
MTQINTDEKQIVKIICVYLRKSVDRDFNLL